MHSQAPTEKQGAGVLHPAKAATADVSNGRRLARMSGQESHSEPSTDERRKWQMDARPSASTDHRATQPAQPG